MSLQSGAATMTLSPTAPKRLWRDTLRFAAVAALLGGLLGLAPVGLGEAQGKQVNHLRVAAKSYGRTQRVEVGLNKSMIVDLPAEVREVIVSQPGVAGAIMRSKYRAIIQGIAAGDTNIFFLDAAGEAISILEVSVTGDASGLAASINQLLPGSAIEVQAFNGRIILSGYAQSEDDVQKAILIAGQFAGSADNVASIINIAGSQQVMLKVTLAEVSRDAVKQLGINISGSYTNGGLTTGIVSTQPLGGASSVLTNNGMTASLSAGGLTLSATMRALERRGAIRTLAEPNLTAMSGKQAEFFAGGEFPVGTGTDDNGNLTFEFKEFGARLKFTPTVKSNGVIGLIVDTSVSEPTPENSLSVGGVTIPGIKNRQANTSVELGAGETLAIAGLMQDSVRQQINKLPGLGDIPILGTLFRSRDFIRNQTELVILVTPYLAYAGDKPVLPTDKSAVASDAEAIFLGHMEKSYGVGPHGMRGSFDGSVGFVLD